jgi:hypothetical protein
MSARGKSSKKGFSTRIATQVASDSSVDLNATVNILDIVASQSPTIVPPTTVPVTSNYLLPPTNISAAPSQIFTSVSVSANGSTATYTTTQNHGYSTGDIVIVSGFANTSFNGTFTIISVTNKTFTISSTQSGSDTNGSVYNNNNYVGTITYAPDGTPYVDVTVSFDEVVNAVEYRIEVTQIA